MDDLYPIKYGQEGGKNKIWWQNVSYTLESKAIQ